MSRNFRKALLNFLALSILIAILILPIVFAKNFGQVAGAKFEQKYILISQIENFPGFSFTQDQSGYSLKFSKKAKKQAFLSVFKIYNPKNVTAEYKVKFQPQDNKVFFGENLDTLTQTVILPSGTSASVSLLASGSEEIVHFTIEEI